MNTPALTVLSVLKKARTLINKPGVWIKGRLEQRNIYENITGYCALGAMQKVAWGFTAESPNYSELKKTTTDEQKLLYTKSEEALQEAICAILEKNRKNGECQGDCEEECYCNESVDEFNDNENRTKKEVVAAFDKAIAAVEAREA